MHRRGLVDIDHRAIKNYKVVDEALPNGRHALIVTTLQGVLVDRIEGDNRQEAMRHLAEMGYERIPSYVAFEIDQATETGTPS